MSDIYIFRNALRDLLRAKKLAAAIVLILLPTLIAVLWRMSVPVGEFNPTEVYNLLASGVVFNFILVILAVVFGTGVIAQEVEQKTIVYLLTRPVPRWRILLMKFFAAVLVTTATAWIATLLLAAVSFGAGGQGTSGSMLRLEQIKDTKAFVTQLNETPEPVLLYLHEKLSSGAKSLVDNYDDTEPPTNTLLATVLSSLNRAMERGSLYDKEAFAEVKLSAKSQELLAENPTGKAAAALNRSLLQDVFPQAITPAGEASLELWRDLRVLAVGAFAYTALFLLMGTLLPRPLTAGLLFAFGWESWVPSLPGNFEKMSLMAYLHTLAPHPGPEEEATSTLSLLASTAEKEIISSPLAWKTLFCVTAAALIAALIIFSTREYVPREDT